MNSDIRVHHMRMLRSMGVSESIAFFYPRMVPVFDMEEKVMCFFLLYCCLFVGNLRDRERMEKLTLYLTYLYCMLFRLA